MARQRSWISGHFGEPAPWPGVTSADVSGGACALDDTVAARTLSKSATTRVDDDRHLDLVDVIARRSTPRPRNVVAVSVVPGIEEADMISMRMTRS